MSDDEIHESSKNRAKDAAEETAPTHASLPPSLPSSSPLTQLQLVSEPVGRQVVIINESLQGRAQNEEEVFVEEGDFKVGAGEAGREGEEEGGGGGGEEETQVGSPFLREGGRKRERRENRGSVDPGK